MRISQNDVMAILIDMQERIMPTMCESIEDRAGVLVSGLLTLEIPIIGTEQYPKGLGETISSLKELLNGEIYQKVEFSACKNSAIKAKIREIRRENVLVFGLEAHICVLQTCLDLKKMGLNPILVSDCAASRREFDKQIAIKRAIQENITVATAESVLFELLVSKEHPKFREISKIIK